MENIEYFNVNKIIKITLIDKVESKWFSIKREMKILGITIQKAGIYDLFGKYRDFSDFSDQFLIIDNVIYEKPCVIICFEFP